jgi:hypothetical protein
VKTESKFGGCKMILSDYRESRNAFKSILGEVNKCDMKDFITWLNKNYVLESYKWIPYDIEDLVKEFIAQDKFYSE